ncbi:hypothetical protein ACFQV4_13595 [Streptomyces thermocarboxydus]
MVRRTGLLLGAARRPVRIANSTADPPNSAAVISSQRAAKPSAERPVTAWYRSDTRPEISGNHTRSSSPDRAAGTRTWFTQAVRPAVTVIRARSAAAYSGSSTRS